jgi:hypothetical protein
MVNVQDYSGGSKQRMSVCQVCDDTVIRAIDCGRATYVFCNPVVLLYVF